MQTADDPGFRPAFRRLRVFAHDPSLGLRLDTAPIHETVLKVRWEPDRARESDTLRPGPIGEYLAVIDHDPASKAFYAPVDLNEPYLLAQDGLPASVGDPRFHQQMVYAVAMTTINHFEQALGRVALWAPRLIRNRNGEVKDKLYVSRLRVYPHALREANAYYSPAKRALLFGYFTASSLDRGNIPGGTVFTCLSHDIIAHETTHALLDGMHPRFVEATNADVHALHEAFADVVALFQHFANPQVLEHQIARCRGDLESQNMLGQLAQQFGMAVGQRGALRDALGELDPRTGEWRPKKPDPTALNKASSPHARGAVLVAAVFGAFLSIYRSRVRDLLRIATGGTGELPEGDIHPDLERRLANEAARSANHVLRMCIRALDYCPPVDVTFGDYLRAIITADSDLNPEDPQHYRIAFIESFHRWGIFPRRIRGLSADTLVYPRMDELPEQQEPEPVRKSPRELAESSTRENAAWQQTLQHQMQTLFVPMPLKEQPASEKRKPATRNSDKLILGWDLHSNREDVFTIARENARRFHRWLTQGEGRSSIQRFGLTLDENAPPSVFRAPRSKAPAIEVHAVRTARRHGPRGAQVTELVVEITQRRRGYFDPQEQKDIDSGKKRLRRNDKGDFRFRRGCTLLIDPETMTVRYIIATEGTIVDDTQLEKVRAYLTSDKPVNSTAYYIRNHPRDSHEEDFAMLHRAAQEEVETWQE